MDYFKHNKFVFAFCWQTCGDSQISLPRDIPKIGEKLCRNYILKELFCPSGVISVSGVARGNSKGAGVLRTTWIPTKHQTKKRHLIWGEVMLRRKHPAAALMGKSYQVSRWSRTLNDTWQRKQTLITAFIGSPSRTWSAAEEEFVPKATESGIKSWGKGAGASQRLGRGLGGVYVAR